MGNAFSRFAKEHPSLALLICGVVMFVLPVGFGMNIKTLDEHDLIPSQMRSLLPYIGGFMTAVNMIGFVLILVSIYVAVRPWANPETKLPANDRISS